MLKKAGKRLLVLLPAVWLLASAVFLLSKSIPGPDAEMQSGRALQDANSSAKAEARQRAYRQMLHRTGEDLPLFYFRIGAAAESDTLYKIFPEHDRTALKELALTYGNWPEISAYYGSLQAFSQGLLKEVVSPAMRRKSLTATGQLLETTNADKTRQIFRDLQKTICVSGLKINCTNLRRAERDFERLVTRQTPALGYRPDFIWYGSENQYHRWFRNLLRGDLGFSSRDMRPVTEIIAEAFGLTVWLALAAFALVALLGPAIAILLSRKSAVAWRGPVLGFLYALESVPLFIVALAVLSVAGYWGLFDSFPEGMAMLLAVLVLVVVRLPYLTNQAYVALQSVLGEHYILAARAKGLPENSVLLHHAFRNCLLPLITLLADLFPVLLAGTVVLESVFSLPGMGRLLVTAVLARDYQVIAGLVLLIGFLKMLAHLLADLFYSLADPRLQP